MVSWPLLLTPFSLGSGGVPREAVLEITPRAAAFTLAALSHVGHAAHLALIDAYLKGQMRLTPTAEIGQDSRTVAASLALPLIAAAELGLDRLTLGDLILLPRDLAATEMAEPAPGGGPTRSPDCARMLLRAGDTWHWVRGAERFEVPGCLGTKQVEVGTSWHDVIVELPSTWDVANGTLAPIAAEVRAPTQAISALDATLVSALRSLALARFGRSALLTELTTETMLKAAESSSQPIPGADIRAERTPGPHQEHRIGTWPLDSPADLGRMVSGIMGDRQSWVTFFEWHGHRIDVALTPDPDGYQTLCLLPPVHADPVTLAPLMLDATRAMIVGLIGRPLAEHRTDPITLSLRLDEGDQERVVTLHIGDSVVIVRNQVVFTAWVGSDGRAMLKLFPPGGMHP